MTSRRVISSQTGLVISGYVTAAYRTLCTAVFYNKKYLAHLGHKDPTLAVVYIATGSLNGPYHGKRNDTRTRCRNTNHYTTRK